MSMLQQQWMILRTASETVSQDRLLGARLGAALRLVRDAHGLAQRRGVELARLAAQRRLLAQRLLQPHHAARLAVHQHLAWIQSNQHA